MMRVGTLRVELLADWRCGTGEGRSAMLDATCLRDAQGLPYVPARHLRGLLRDAMRDLEAFAGTDYAGQTRVLFGDVGFLRDQEDVLQARHDTQPGRIWIDNAVLPEASRRWIVAAPGAATELFGNRQTTAIDPARGTALEGALRAEEVAIPLDLGAPVGLMPAGGTDGESTDGLDKTAARELLSEACGLVRGLGAKRARGLGRCLVTLDAA